MKIFGISSAGWRVGGGISALPLFSPRGKCKSVFIQENYRKNTICEAKKKKKIFIFLNNLQ